MYQRLEDPKSIRLLELPPGQRTDALHGELRQGVCLDWGIQYEALSYRWDAFDPRNPTYIVINDMSLPIGPELHSALLQFRHPATLSRLLWIDQICINQEDPVDKRSQIRIMGDIYHSAQKVLIWLGPNDYRTDTAMEAFPLLVELATQAEINSRNRVAVKPLDDLIPSRGTLAASVYTLFERSWFGRVWTLQEAALGKSAEVWCGPASFSFPLLETFAAGCDNDTHGHWGNLLSLIQSASGSQDPEHPNRSLIAHVHTVNLLRQNRTRSSARVLNSLRSLDCSEHQDRIYSVLRFFDPELVDHLTQSDELTPPELYHKVAAYSIQQGGLEYLCTAGRSQQRYTFSIQDCDETRPRFSLPSWVPDWTFTVRVHSYWVLNSDCRDKRDAPLYTAGGDVTQHSEWTTSASMQVLSGRGIIIDEVDKLVAPFRVHRVPEDVENLEEVRATIQSAKADLIDYVAQCMKLAERCHDMYGQSNIQRACRHALVGDMMPDGSTTTQTGLLIRATNANVDSLFEDFEKAAAAPDRLAELYGIFEQRMAESGALSKDEHATMMHSLQEVAKQGALPAHNLMTAMAEACKGRRFFVTKDHSYMGVAPDITRPGDRVCILPGCCAPFIIRPRDGDHYELIGECYVAGLMDGEAMKECESKLQRISFV